MYYILYGTETRIENRLNYHCNTQQFDLNNLYETDISVIVLILLTDKEATTYKRQVVLHSGREGQGSPWRKYEPFWKVLLS